MGHFAKTVWEFNVKSREPTKNERREKKDQKSAVHGSAWKYMRDIPFLSTNDFIKSSSHLDNNPLAIVSFSFNWLKENVNML